MHNGKPRTFFRTRLACFWREESGQGILFAAVSVVILVLFVALVFNVGNLTERRTRVQLAADAAVYSGAMVEANSLSAIAWMNSAMAQLYYNAVKYAVDVNVTGVAALMELKQNQSMPGSAVAAHRETFNRAAQSMAVVKSWMVDLARVENAMAILTPRLAQEEMFAVATRAIASPGELAQQQSSDPLTRISVYPSFRMFPHGSSSISYRVEQLPNGWRVTNLSGGNGEILYVYLQGNEWHLQYSQDGLVIQEVVIQQEDPRRWHISYYEPPGNLIQEVILVQSSTLGWIIYGQNSPPGGSPQPLPQIRFEAVDMDNDGIEEGTRITCESTVQVIKRGEDGNIYLWNFQDKRYVNQTSSDMVVAGVRVNINVTNVIHFPGATAQIGDPVTVNIGRAHIVLSNPPVISTGLGPVYISIRGFDADSFSISVGGFNLGRNDADGRWQKYFNPATELWWRHRLTAMQPQAPGVLQQWQFDHQTIGAYMRADNPERFVMTHAIGDRFGSALPVWYNWFDPLTAKPRNISWRHVFPGHYQAPDADGIRHLRAEYIPMPDVYYLTQTCTPCAGTGKIEIIGPNGQPQFQECPTCHGCDHDAAVPGTDLRVCLGDLLASDDANICNSIAGLQENDYLDARLFSSKSYGIEAVASYPLVLAEEFFQYGMNVGVWRAPDEPMIKERLEADSRRAPHGKWGFVEPDWGFIAISSARVGIPDDTAPGWYRYQFDDKTSREVWCNQSPNNLYYARATAKLYASRDQVKDYDLDRDILQGLALQAESESPQSYLWDAIVNARYNYPYQTGGWLTEYEGRDDRRVSDRLRNMHDRQGRRFDYGSDTVDSLVKH